MNATIAFHFLCTIAIKALNTRRNIWKTYRFKTYRSRKWVSLALVGKALWKVKNIPETCSITGRIWELLCRFWRGTRILICLSYMAAIFYEEWAKFMGYFCAQKLTFCMNDEKRSPETLQKQYVKKDQGVIMRHQYCSHILWEIICYL